jgi:adenylate cyclase
MSDEPPPTDSRREPAWRRAWARLQHLRRPLIVLAGVGTLLGGLAGYWNAYRAARDAAGERVSAPTRPAELSERTIAVLPFSNLGNDPADAAFAEGLGEELVHLLTRVKGLRVTARRSALQFKGQQLPMTDMAQRLQSAYLVDGSVRRMGDTVRIGAQLVDGRSGAVLWSGQFERDLKDVLAAQTDLALQVGRSLKLPLDASTLAGSGTKNLKAWQLFQQAQRQPPGDGGREALYRQALALDPAFARVHVELAEEELQRHHRTGTDGRSAADSMVPHLEAALRIDPHLALAHGRLATAAAMRDDLETVARHARKALELDPGDAAGHHWTAELALHELRIDDALAEHRALVDLEPLAALARLHYGNLLRLTGQQSQALAPIEQALLLEPDWPEALFEKAMALLALGRREEALVIARRHNWIEIFGLAGSADDLAAARALSGLNEHRRASLAFFDGQYDTFFDHFEKDHSNFMDRNRAPFDPMLDRVREHPRFKAWLARHGMEQAHQKAQAWRAANPPR